MSKLIKKQDSRRIFIETLIELAEKDPRIVLIVPDVGFHYIEEFQKKFPDRFYNFGVTEEATMLIASALALSGLKPYVFSMINFVTFRVHEVVRNAVGLHNADVKILGVKGSKGYKFLGFSHNLVRKNEEIDFLKKIPNFECFTPSKKKVEETIEETYKNNKPTYIRL
jgi:transketolase